MHPGSRLYAALSVAGAVLVAGGAVVGARASAGAPTPMNVVLCGSGSITSAQADNQSGKSSIDHPAGFSFTGTQQPQGASCSPSNSSGSDFSWTMGHGAVNTTSERGTEHGLFMLASSSKEAGFNGQISDYDFQSGGDGQTCGSQTVFYSSGHADFACQIGSGAGNFNTHGGAATGDHFRGFYGTYIYQQNDNSHRCDDGSMNYCIAVALNGQTN